MLSPHWSASRVALFVTAALCNASALAAQSNARTPFHGAPRATWLAPPDVPQDTFVVFHARRGFTLPERPTTFVIHASADNRYRLFVNGVSVATGPQRADVAHWRHETIDIAPMLRVGRNVIAAVIWNWGAQRPLAQHSLRTAFVVQGDTPAIAAIVNTGPGWKLRVDSAYAPMAFTYQMVGGYYAAAPGESVDAARVPWGWQHPDYVDDAWYTVVANDGAHGAGRLQLRADPDGSATGEVAGWQVMPRSLPPMDEVLQRFRQLRRVEGVAQDDAFVRGSGELLIPARTTATLLVDQGHTTNAYPTLETSGGAGATVTLTYAEALIDARGQKGHRDSITERTMRGVFDVFKPSGERRVFQPLWWRSYRYVALDIVTGEEPLRVHDLHGVFTAYPFVARGRFTSDARWIDSVWAMSWNGARIGAHETYMDTPYYEQLQYVGDTRLQALISLYVSGDDRLARQALEQFDDSRLSEGITQSRYPSSLTQLIPPFSLVHVAIVHDYHMLRSDSAFVRRLLPGVRTVLDWYARRVDSTGLVGAAPYWTYMDWTPRWQTGTPPGSRDGHPIPVSLLYAYALQRAAALEDDLTGRDAGAFYRARSESVLRAVRASAWDASRGLFRDRARFDHPDSVSYSQHTNTLAVLTGAVPRAQRGEMMRRVLHDTTLAQASYYFSWYVLEAMREAGLSDQYLDQLAPWRGMLALGLTSPAENPEPTRSDTHAWSAHPLHGLLATVLGVRPASPGFRVVRIAPALGSLRRVSGRVAHPRGDIEVELTRVGASGVRAHVTLPPGTTGVFVWRGQSRVLRAGAQEVTYQEN